MCQLTHLGVFLAHHFLECNILNANYQLFFLTQFVRLYFALPCTLYLTVFVRLYFVLRPQVFQLVARQSLTQVVRLFLAVQLNFQSFSHCFLFRCFIRRRPHPRVELFAPAVFPFYCSAYLQLFGSFYIQSNTLQFCLQAYVLSYQKIVIFLSEKDNL